MEPAIFYIHKKYLSNLLCHKEGAQRKGKVEYIFEKSIIDTVGHNQRSSGRMCGCRKGEEETREAGMEDIG